MILTMVLVLGVSTVFWSCVGLLRFASEFYVRAQSTRANPKGRSRHRSTEAPINPADVAVLMAAHNEALIIDETIEAAAVLVPRQNIHVISDKSSDDTAAIARAAGARVLELEHNVGKAGALAAGIDHFGLCESFKVVLLLDADTRPTPEYLETGLPMFSDPTVVAVAGRARSIMGPHAETALGRFLVAYRERLYIVIQLLHKYGQAARGANVVSIVPGFASMYRTSALAEIEVLAPGLVIEDFNMTFEIHAKKLGRIAFHPKAAIAYTQDPDNLSDYVKQMRRWILGFWQTVKRHGLQSGLFWFVLMLYMVELVVSCVFFALLIPAFLLSCVASAAVWIFGNDSELLVTLAHVLQPQDILLGVLIPDFLLTVLAAISLRRPTFLLMGPLFPLMRILDAVICLWVLPRAYLGSTSGVWVSPVRRAQRPTRGESAEAISDRGGG